MKLLSQAAEAASYTAISYGFWLAWHPLGFIVGGVLLLQTVVDIAVPARKKDKGD